MCVMFAKASSSSCCLDREKTSGSPGASVGGGSVNIQPGRCHQSETNASKTNRASSLFTS